MIELETLMLFLLAAVMAPVVGAATVFFLSYWKGKGMVAPFLKSKEIGTSRKSMVRLLKLLLDTRNT